MYSMDIFTTGLLYLPMITNNPDDAKRSLRGKLKGEEKHSGSIECLGAITHYAIFARS
jgi:hypothetical protein